MACGGCGQSKSKTTVYRPSTPVSKSNVVGTQVNTIRTSNIQTEEILQVGPKRQNIPLFTVAKNLVQALQAQPDKVKWVKDGVTGILKCVSGDTLYTDDGIQDNRNKCRNCEYSTKTNGELTSRSQCMAPDPSQDNQPCGCIILCKTQSGHCPLGKFTALTIQSKSHV